MGPANTVLRNFPSRAFLKTYLCRLLVTPPFSEWYWRIAPRVHRRRRYLSSEYVDPPIDPFGLFLVDPDQISRFTGREFPVWTTRWKDFGAVMGTDWDRRERPPVRSGYRGPDPSLYLAERVTETRLHRGLSEHFVNDVPWDDLAFIDELMERVQSTDTSVWQDCKTVAEIRQYCNELDRLYQDIRDRGCLSMRELNACEDRRMSFREVMENEILVDVTRTGEPVFVTGRHRLSIAKILNLDRIPVAVVVRHPNWIAHHGGTPYTDSDPRNESPSDAGSTVMEPFNVSW